MGNIFTIRSTVLLVTIRLPLVIEEEPCAHLACGVNNPWGLSDRPIPNPQGKFNNGNRDDRERDGKNRLFEDGHAQTSSMTGWPRH